MSTGIHRAVELVIAFALVGYCAYAIYTEPGVGRSFAHTAAAASTQRSFWVSVLITFGIGLAFLFGAVSWRN